MKVEYFELTDEDPDLEHALTLHVIDENSVRSTIKVDFPVRKLKALEREITKYLDEDYSWGHGYPRRNEEDEASS